MGKTLLIKVCWQETSRWVEKEGITIMYSIHKLGNLAWKGLRM
jgi:hypothetical protein